MIVDGTVPNMINGISQQPSTIRLPSQGEIQENCYPSLVEGNKKRSPTQHIARIHPGTLADAYIKTINRDTVEQYVMVATDGDLKVYDIDGVAKTVNFPNGKGYLSTLTPGTTLRAITIADYTFILNTEVTTAMKADLSFDPGVEALYHVRQGSYQKTYTVTVDGNIGTYSTSGTDAWTLATTHIAGQIKLSLEGLLTGFTLQRSGSTVLVRKDDASDFTISSTDPLGDSGIYHIKNSTQHFTDLPTVAPQDFIAEITGDDGVDADNYYVSFEVDGSDGGAGTFGRGTWVETIAKGIPFKIDPATMPHTLVRNGDGTFTFDQTTWDDRTVGDETSAPDPSFIGKAINDIFFFKNRLGFLSDQNVNMSKAGSYFQFFPDTVTTLLADAPIDVAANHTKVSILQRAVAYDEQLVIFSDHTQFILKGAEVLSSTNAQIDASTEYEASLLASPISVDNKVYFATDAGSYDRVMEYSVEADSKRNIGDDITAHAPKYLVGDTHKLIATSNDGVLMTLSTGAPNQVTVYNAYKDKESGQRLQSAWHKWYFYTTSKVLNADMIGNDLYLVMQHGDGVYLEKMSLATKQYDPYTEQFSDEGYTTHLDRRITDAELVSAVYDSGTGITTLTLPYNIEGDYEVVTRAVDMGTVIPATSLNIASTSVNTIAVYGDHSATPLYIGQKYKARYRFSDAIAKQRSQASNTPIAISNGRLQLLKWVVTFANSGAFRAEVTPTNNDTFTYHHTGRVIGDADNVLGGVAIVDGTLEFPVMAENTQVVIDLINDTFLPSSWLSAEWVGRLTKKSRRV